MLAFHNEHIASCAFLTYFSPESTTAANSPTTPTATVLNDKQSLTGMPYPCNPITRRSRLYQPYYVGTVRSRVDLPDCLHIQSRQHRQQQQQQIMHILQMQQSVRQKQQHQELTVKEQQQKLQLNICNSDGRPSKSC